MSCPQTIVAFAPMVAPCFTSVCKYSPLRLTELRGLITLVNTIDGPRNTSSSHLTPVYIETLFCTLTFFPSTTCGEITTFCPILQFSPITQSGMMWEKCQILVPAPIEQPSSMTAVGCAKYFVSVFMCARVYVRNNAFKRLTKER